MVAPTNVRFPDAVDNGLTAYAQQTGTRKSAIITTAVREWLRMQKHPGIVFVPTITGERHAALAVGPEVWTVAESWLQHDKSERTAVAVAEALGLAPTEVEVALGYWADYEDEINELIARHHASQDEALAAWERRRALDDV